MNAERELTHHYLSLPYAVRHEIMSNLGVTNPLASEEELADLSRDTVWLKRVSRKKLLADLWDAVNAKMPDGKKKSNRFKGVSDQKKPNDGFYTTKVTLELEYSNYMGPEAALSQLKEVLTFPAIKSLKFVKAETDYVVHQPPSEEFKGYPVEKFNTF